MDKIINYFLKLPNKILHFGASFGVEIALAVALPFWQPWARFSANVIVVGGGKEWYDSRHPDKHSADWGDIAACSISIGRCVAVSQNMVMMNGGNGNGQNPTSDLYTKNPKRQKTTLSRRLTYLHNCVISSQSHLWPSIFNDSRRI